MTATTPERTEPVPLRVGDRVRYAGAAGVVICFVGEGLARVALEGRPPLVVPALALERLG